MHGPTKKHFEHMWPDLPHNKLISDLAKLEIKSSCLGTVGSMQNQRESFMTSDRILCNLAMGQSRLAGYR